MFNEKDYESVFEGGQMVDLKVWKSPKYEESKAKALEIINADKFKGKIKEGDFWILMNRTKSGKMAYTGLIISHNGCLKLNDLADEKDKFKPDCVSYDNNGYANSLVFTYSCPEQGIYEVGEVSAKNCKNEYPYAMAFKRCFDRVVLKISKLAFSGIYSDSEAEEFCQQIDPQSTEAKQTEEKKITAEQIEELKKLGFTDERFKRMIEYSKVSSLKDVTYSQAEDAIKKLKRAKAKAEAKNV